MYGVKKLSWGKKNFNTTLEPGPVQVYNYLGQLKWTHQTFRSERQDIEAKGTHLVSGPHGHTSGKARQPLFIAQCPSSRERPGQHLCSETEITVTGGRKSKEKKLARKKYEELRHITGNEVLLGKRQNTTPCGRQPRGDPECLSVTKRGAGKGKRDLWRLLPGLRGFWVFLVTQE